MVERSTRIGTRGSALARWQTDAVADLLRAAWPQLQVEIQVIQTQGDRVPDKPLPMIGGKGVFTAELESALRAGEIDFAVHSLKDLPTENPDGLTIGGTPKRATPNDALVSRAGHTLAMLQQGATIGTSSRRRAAQLLYQRPDLNIADIRGNVDTRIRKALDSDGQYDAILLAAAGLERLGQMGVVTELLPLDVMLPAPGQASMAVQCRNDSDSRSLLAPVNDAQTEIAVTAERAFLAGLGGGCSLPIAAYATIEGDRLRLRGRVSAPDGSEQVDIEQTGAATIGDARQLGSELAREALGRGVARLLESLA
jgi:hydroxymethylbilane synthase